MTNNHAMTSAPGRMGPLSAKPSAKRQVLRKPLSIQIDDHNQPSFMDTTPKAAPKTDDSFTIPGDDAKKREDAPVRQSNKQFADMLSNAVQFSNENSASSAKSAKSHPDDLSK